jgi:hypothetical protein
VGGAGGSGGDGGAGGAGVDGASAVRTAAGGPSGAEGAEGADGSEGAEGPAGAGSGAAGVGAAGVGSSVPSGLGTVVGTAVAARGATEEIRVVSLLMEATMPPHPADRLDGTCEFPEPPRPGASRPACPARVQAPFSRLSGSGPTLAV